MTTGKVVSLLEIANRCTRIMGGCLGLSKRITKSKLGLSALGSAYPVPSTARKSRNQTIDIKSSGHHVSTGCQNDDFLTRLWLQFYGFNWQAFERRLDARHSEDSKLCFWGSGMHWCFPFRELTESPIESCAIIT